MVKLFALIVAEIIIDIVTTEKLLYLPNNNRTYIQNTYVAVVDLIPKSTNKIKTRGQWANTSALRRGRFPLCLGLVLSRDKWIGLRLSLEGYANNDKWAIMERFVIALFVCPARR